MTSVRDWLLEQVENLIVGFDKPGKNQRDQMGINGMRNLFENNELPDKGQHLDPVDEKALEETKVMTVLPDNEPGEHYGFHVLSDGRIAVIVMNREKRIPPDPFNRNRIG